MKYKAAAFSLSVISFVVLQTSALDALYLDPSVSLFSEKYNSSMEWGTFKPNQFFAVKDRSPNPLTVGLLWAVPKG